MGYNFSKRTDHFTLPKQWASMRVAKKLEKEGRSVSIYSCHTIKPIDKDRIEEIMRQEGWKRGFSEMAPLDSNPDIYAWATGWKRFAEQA